MNILIRMWKAWREGMEEFGQTISVVVNSILLSIVYILGVGLTSLVAKLIGKHFLGDKKEHDSYWKDLDLGKEDIDNYYREY